MSLLPYLLEEFSRPILHDQYFGLGLLDDDIVVPRHSLQHAVPSMTRRYHSPWRLVAAPDSGLSRIQNDKNGFKVNLDVQQFKPDEVNVKVVDDYVVIDGKHEERSDEHGFISRQFTRRYKIPENVDPNAITSTLSSDGVLSIGAPKKTIENNKEARSVPIVHTNQPSIKVSDKKEKDSSEKMES
ncbi:alpha-crystallin A chain-like [Daktulosphaira vitifoliae]|uniref:alpha-crystallin A chain-like n=1 Tax=Daktulosphaira vitifoliae TaxID=58002 RepID=UPI0021AA9475|nr:alpha-crystallin A chain-like [Daktulosphaira vitifoliae]